jgi:cell division transport system permease protein
MPNKTLSKSLKREKLLVISNIAVMTITFLIFGAFITLVAFSQTALKGLEKQAQVTAFFKDEFKEDQIMTLKKQLEEDARVDSVQYVSKEAAFDIFTEINKNDPELLENLRPSILPASIKVRTKNIADLPILAEELGKVDGVEEIKFFEDVIERFKYWSNMIYVGGFSVVALFLIISFSIVIVTLRITINARGEELEILKLVGASDAYVQKPLLQQGIFFGVVSALIASAILSLILAILQIKGIFGGYIELGLFTQFSVGYLVFILSLAVILITSGFILGYLGSLTAIKKYLRY